MPVPGRGPSLARARSCCPGPRARGMGERTAFSLLITRRPGHARSKPAQCAIAARQCGTDKALHWLELGGHWQASGVRRATAVTEWMPGRDLHFRTSPCRRSPSERPTTRRPGIPPGAITALAPPSPAPAPTCASKRRTKTAASSLLRADPADIGAPLRRSFAPPGGSGTLASISARFPMRISNDLHSLHASLGAAGIGATCSR